MMTDISRRDFLGFITSGLLAASGLLGLTGLVRFLQYQGETVPKTEFDLGAASDYPLGTHLLPDIPAVLIHTEDGFTAISLTCTHLGCTVEQQPGGFECPCHGSQFETKGVVLRGPAARPLRLLRVEVTDDDQLHLCLA